MYLMAYTFQMVGIYGILWYNFEVVIILVDIFGSLHVDKVPGHGSVDKADKPCRSRLGWRQVYYDR